MRSPVEPAAYFLEEPSLAVGWALRSRCVSTRATLLLGSLSLSGHHFIFQDSVQPCPSVRSPQLHPFPDGPHNPHEPSPCADVSSDTRRPRGSGSHPGLWVLCLTDPWGYWAPNRWKLNSRMKGGSNPKPVFLSFFFLFYSTIVNSQHYVNFCCTAKWFSYTYIYTHSFSYSFPL